MAKIINYKLCGISAVVLILFLLSGRATHSGEKIFKQQDYTTADKYILDVNLKIPDELRNYSVVLPSGGALVSDFKFDLGQDISENIEKVVRSSFNNVKINSDDEKLKNAFDATIDVQVVLISWTRPMYANQDVETVMFFEWTLANSEGDPIWIRTVKGVGTSTLWDREPSVYRALEDVFRNSFKEITNSYEIKMFAQKIKQN